MKKKLYRSDQSKVIAGVCGGLGDYFEIDPAIIRIVAVVLVFANGIGLVAYAAAWVLIPRSPAGAVVESTQSEPSELRKYIPGLLLILVGVAFLLNRLFWWFHWGVFWPAILILIGAGLIWRSATHSETEKANGGAHESVES